MIATGFQPVLALLLSLAAIPPDTIQTGAHALGRAALIESSETFDSFSMRDTVEVKNAVVQVSIAPVANIWNQWVIVTRWSRVNGGATSVDSLTVSTHPLRPILHRVRAESDSAEIIYNGVQVSGWVAPGAGKPRRQIDAKLSRRAFPEGFREMLISFLPLHAAYEADLAAFDAWSGEGGTERMLGVNVVGVDTLVAAGRAQQCWKVAVDRRDASGILQALWIGTKDRRVLRTEARDRAGKLLWWKVAR